VLGKSPTDLQVYPSDDSPQATARRRFGHLVQQYIRATIPRKLQRVRLLSQYRKEYIRATIPRKLQPHQRTPPFTRQVYPSDDSPQATASHKRYRPPPPVYPSDDSPQATARLRQRRMLTEVYPSDDSPQATAPRHPSPRS